MLNGNNTKTWTTTLLLKINIDAMLFIYYINRLTATKVDSTYLG